MTNLSSVIWKVLLAAQVAVAAAATPLDPVSARPGVKVSPYIRHWESARYERATPRRGRGAPQHLRIHFTAHNRDFKLRLRPDAESVFADDVEFHGTSGPLRYATDRVYAGTLEDDENSIVYGVITSDGLFDGTISTPSAEYYVEPLSRYDSDTHSGDGHTHSLVYNREHVQAPARNDTVACASHLMHLARQRRHVGSIFELALDELDAGEAAPRVRRWLPQEEREAPPPANPDLPLDLDVPYTNGDGELNHNDRLSTRKPKSKTGLENLIFKNNRGVIGGSFDDEARPKTHVEIIKSKTGVIREDTVSKKPIGFTIVSTLPGNVTDTDLRHVNKRATIDPKKTTCMLYLQADHMFYQKYGSEEACIDVMTRHVQKVNAIYKVTDFNQDGKPDNITFMIKRIKVHTLDALKDPQYRFPGNYGVEKYLELFSEEDYDAFCLAYMFTYRDFEMGTLGLAWTGDLKNAGGVCEKNGHYRGSMKSLNTGIVTLLNYGKHVPPAVSHVTLAHEIGHNFGSPHDPEVCTPGGEDGNFIMFARATSGDKKNNNRFSPCSLRCIDPVLNSKARSAKGCFTEPQAAICGNGVVERGEECDCGWVGECSDACCHPQSARPAPGHRPCTLTRGSLCSPSQGPCCTSRCTLKFSDKCREDNGCRDASYCDGRRPQCPPSIDKPNRTRCDKEFVCYMGECTGSICLAYGLESCQCTASAGDPPSKACELCCRRRGGPCRSSFAWNTPPYDVPDMHAKPGTPCNDYNGYCDVFQKCREVDPSGPLATLRRLLLSEESIASFKRWILDHWYAVVLIITAVIALLILSTKWLGKKPDPKLKSVTIIHSSTTETVRLPEHCPEGVIVHTAIRSKVPLKKKVALKTRSRRDKKDKIKGTGDAASPSKGKKRVTDPARIDEQRNKLNKEATTGTSEVKPKKHVISKHKPRLKKRKNKLKKEVIDYSSLQKDATLSNASDNDALGRVQKWLLSSPDPAPVPKSKSTPLELSNNTSSDPSNVKRATVRTSRSATNLPNAEVREKARLQVVYKPPFKFSLKLCKSDKTKTSIDKSGHSRSEATKRKGDNALCTGPDTPKVDSETDVIPVPLLDENKVCQGSTALNIATDTNYENALPRSASERKITKPNVEKAGKLGHKKSSSMGQNREMAESRQNLLAREQLVTDQSTSHVYENVVSSRENQFPKSCSMPRRSTIGEKTILRQSSYSQLPRAHVRPTQRPVASRHGSTTDLAPVPAERTGPRSTNPMHKGNSLNCIPNAIRDTRNRHSNPDGYQLYANVAGLADKGKARLSRASDSARSRDKLQRQLSENEIGNRMQRVELNMPVSAGADPSDVNLAGFRWSLDGERLSVDCGVAAETVQMPFPETSKGNSTNPFNNALESINVPAVKTRSLREIPSNLGWPQTFGNLKDTLPDCNSEVHQSDMEVLLSDDDFLKSDI